MSIQNFKGASWSSEDSKEAVVLEATLTPNELRLSFEEDRSRKLLSASSRDGRRFEGSWKYARRYEGYDDLELGVARLTLVRGTHGEVVLYGDWEGFGDDKGRGRWLIVLTPVSPVADDE